MTFLACLAVAFLLLVAAELIARGMKELWAEFKGDLYPWAEFLFVMHDHHGLLWPSGQRGDEQHQT